MSKLEVKSYELGWNVRTREGFVRIRLSDERTGAFKVDTLNELAGWASLLRETPLYAGKDGWIHTGPEPVGDALHYGSEIPFPFGKRRVKQP